MTHLAFEQLTTPGQATDAVTADHLRTCTQCRQQAAAWAGVAVASRTAAAEMTGPVRVPSFDVLLGGVLPVRQPAQPVPVVRPSFGTSWRLAGALVAAQWRLIPRSLLPLTAAGLGAAVAIAAATRVPETANRLFASVVTLVILLSVTVACSRRSDPRMELPFTLPVSPSAVFGARLVLALLSSLAMAVAASIGAAAAGAGTGMAGVVSGWLGQALLASAAAVAVTVWRSAAWGAVTGAAMWLTGSVLTLPGSVLAERLQPVVSQIWGTTPWTLAASVALIGVALRAMKFPELDSAES
ncbi:hypothetical protein [Actinoplanes sp. NPDC051859]|uniref:hypothetical protein n=1 Tax=Actinoplanes sp. NPDC051859 TaxID=3363909 RepID=UPI00379FCDA8